MGGQWATPGVRNRPSERSHFFFFLQRARRGGGNAAEAEGSLRRVKFNFFFFC
jgi:hypothetical protein